VVKSCVYKWSVNPITNPNPVYGHSKNHHQCQSSPFWEIAFLRRFCHITSSFHFFVFRKNSLFTQRRTPNLEDQVSVVMSLSDSYSPRNRVPLCRLLRLAGLRWRYSSAPPHGDLIGNNAEKGWWLGTGPSGWMNADVFSELITSVVESQIRFPMRSLDFSIYLIVPAALWPWGRLSL
jgi:hypothetical protein